VKIGDFLLITLAVAIGTIIALGVAGIYLKQQVSSASSGNTTLGAILSLFTPKAS
jgi:hypothetical protein